MREPINQRLYSSRLINTVFTQRYLQSMGNRYDEPAQFQKRISVALLAIMERL